MTLKKIAWIRVNLRLTFYHVNCAIYFYNHKVEGLHPIEIMKWTPLKLKNFWASKTTISRVKRLLPGWKKIFANRFALD